MVSSLEQLIEHPIVMSALLLSIGVAIAFGPEIRQVFSRIDASDDDAGDATERSAAAGTR